MNYVPLRLDLMERLLRAEHDELRVVCAMAAYIGLGR